MDREDIFTLAKKLDDIIDCCKAAIERMDLYNIGEPSERMQEMAELILKCGKQVEKAISALKNSGVSGFDYDAKKIVNSYVRHEMIKKRNINRVMRERRQEAWSEDLLGGKNSATGSASQSSTRQKPKLKF